MHVGPLYNSPDKTLYDVTFARRFSCGKQIIVCKQTRLRAVVLVAVLPTLRFSREFGLVFCGVAFF